MSLMAMFVVRHLSHRLVLLKFSLLVLLSVGVSSCSLKTSVEDLVGITDKPVISVSDLNLVEGTSGNIVFVLSRPWTNTIIISYNSADNTAISPSDFTSISGNLTITAGQTSATLSVTTLDDLLYEGTENYDLELSVPANATFSGSALNVSKSFEIIDNETLPTVQYAAATSNNSEGSTPHTVEVILSGPVQAGVSVNYAVAGGTATGAGVDYTLSSGVLTFASGETIKNISIPVVDDAIFEGAETIGLNLTAPTLVTLGSQTTHIHTINDNEMAPTVQYAAATSVALESTSPHVVAVTLSNASSSAVTVDYAITGGTATDGGVDYTLANGTLTFAAGVTTQNISMPIVNDSLYEGNETVTFNISNPTVATLGGQTTHVHTITDDEALPTVQYATPASNASEGSTPHAIAVTLSGAVQATVVVNYNVTGGTATGSGADYTLANGTLTFASGVTTQNISIPVIDDALFEGAETIVLDIATPTIVTLGSQVTHTHTITDNDGAPVITFNQATANSNENAGSVNIQVDLSNQSSTDVVVDYTVTGGSAAGVGVDYTLANGTFTFTAGQTVKNISLSIVDDAISELTETIQITLSNPVGGTVGVPGLHTHSIIDNEALPIINFAGASASTGEATASQTIPVTLSAASSQVVTVEYTVTGGTASGGGVDYTITNGTLTFAAGVTTQNIALAIVNDVLAEGPETILITVANPNAYATIGPTYVHTHTILDDESAPTVQYASATSSANENIGSHTIQVTLGAVDSSTVTVQYAVTSGTATGTGIDYTLAGGTLTFLSGETTKNIVVSVVDDILGEPAETIEITLSNVLGGVSTLGSPSVHTFTINASDTPTIQFAAATSNYVENTMDGSALVLVQLSNTAVADATVVFNVVGGGSTATNPADYSVLTASPLTIAAGQTVATIVIPVVNDSLYEGNETIDFELSSPSANVTLGSQVGHVVTIVDDETVPTVQFAVATSNDDEATTPHNVVVTLSGAAAGSVTVSYAVTGGGATGSGVDYTFAGSTLTFSTGETTKTLAIAIVDDTTDEMGETIELGLSSPSGATLGSQATHIHTINDNDDPPVLSIAVAAATVAEAVGTHNIVVALDHAKSSSIVVNLTLGGTATGGGVDYTRATSFTIPSGTTSYTVPVVVVNDSAGESDETIVLTMTSVTGGASVASIHATNNVQTVTITDDDAAPFTWLGTLGNGDWTQGGNWQGGVVPGVSDTAIFTNACGSTCNVTAPNGTSVGGINMQATYTGTITSSGSLAVGSGGWTQTAGNFVGGSGAISIAGATNVTAGNFTSTSGVLTIAGTDYIMHPTAFAHNSGTVKFSPIGAGNLQPGTSDYNNIEFEYGAMTINMQGETLNVRGLLTTKTTSALAYLNNGVVNVYGDILTISSGINGGVGTSGASMAAVITVVGTSGAQTITGPGSFARLTINSASTVNLVGTIGISRNLTHIASAAFNAGTSTVRATSGAVNETFNLNGVRLYNLTTAMSGAVHLDFAGQTVYVDNNLDLGASATSQLNDGTIIVAGNLISAGGAGGSAIIEMVGSGKTITQSVGAILPEKLRINTAGAIGLASNVTLAASGADLDLQSGTINQNGFNLSIDDILSTSAGTVINQLCANLTYALHSPALGTINTSASSPNVTIADVSQLEGNSGTAPMPFVVTLSEPVCGANFTINYATANGTATQPSDYNSASSTLTIASGQTVGTINVTVKGDNTVEPDETFVVNLTTASHGTITDAQATGTLLNNDTSPFEWTGLGGNSNWTTGGNWRGGAAPGSSNTAIFNNSCSGAQCNVTINSTISIHGVNMMSNYTGTITQAAGSTINIDTTGWAQAAGTFTGGSDPVNFSSTAVSITGGTYTATSGVTTVGSQTLNIGAGAVFNQTAGTFKFPYYDSDIIAAASHQFYNIELGSVVEVFGVVKVKNNLIINGNAAGLYTGTIEAYGSVTEIDAGGSNMPGLIKVMGSTNQTVTGTTGKTFATLEIASTGGTVTLAGPIGIGTYKYTSGTVDPGSSTIILKAYGGNNTFGTTVYNNLTLHSTVYILDTAIVGGEFKLDDALAGYDGAVEARGNVTVNNGTSSTIGTLTLTGSADQTLTRVAGSWMGGTITVNKTDGFVNLASNVILSQYGQDLNVTSGKINMNGYNLTISDSSGTDNVLTLGATSRIYRGCGTLTYEAFAGTGVIYEGKRALFSIADAPAVTEGASSSFVVSLSEANCVNTTFNYTTSSGTAIDGTDYTSTSTVGAFFPIGATTYTISVTTTDDAAYEPTEYYTITLSSLLAGSGAVDIVGQGVINDNDSAPTVEFAAASQTFDEAVGTATVVLNLSAAAGYDITVPFTMTGTATAGATDYTAPSSPITITAGHATRTVTFAINDDALSEPSETVIFTLGTPTNATLGATTVHTATITDNEAPQVDWSAASQTFDEFNGMQGDPWPSMMANWGKRVKIYFNNIDSATAHDDFPLLVVLSGNKITYSDCLPNGNDIRFVDADGTTVLNYEKSAWVSGGLSYLWVRVPQITAASAEDYIYMYYNNPAAGSGANAAGVWDANFKSVFHVDELLSGDVTGNGIGTTWGVGSSVETGQVYKSYKSTGSYISSSNTSVQAITGAMTVEAWVKIDSLGYASLFYSKSGTGGARLYYDGKFNFEIQNSSGGVFNTEAVTNGTFVDDDTWYYVVGTYSDVDDKLSVFVNGVPDRVATGVTGVLATGSPAFFMARENTATGSVNGAVDEIRVSNVVRSNDWIKAQYRNMSDSFAIYSAPQVKTQGTVTLTANLTVPAASVTTIPFTVGGTSTSADHTAANGTLTIGIGASSAQTQFVVYRDQIAEGSETVTYTMGTPTNADLGSTTIHTVTITNHTNTAPVANNDSTVSLPDALPSLSVLMNDTDADSDTLLLVGGTQPTYGTVYYLGAAVMYVPLSGFTGIETVTYTITDGNGGFASATATFTVRSPFNWTGGAGTTNWATGGNWYGSAAPGSSDTAYFSNAFCGANCNATMTASPTNIGNIKMSQSYTGTVSQGAVATNISGTSSSGGLYIAGGTFAGANNSSAMTVSGPLTLFAGATLTATNGNLNFGRAITCGSSATNYKFYGTFNHNSGTVVFNHTTPSNSVSCANPYQYIDTLPTTTFYNLTIDTYSTGGYANKPRVGFTEEDDTAIIANTLTVNSGGSIGGHFLIRGNLVANCQSLGRCATNSGPLDETWYIFDGSSNSSYSVNNNTYSYPQIGKVAIQKSSNLVTVSSSDNRNIAFSKLELLMGEFIAPSGTLYLGKAGSFGYYPSNDLYKNGGLFTHNNGTVYVYAGFYAGGSGYQTSYEFNIQSPITFNHFTVDVYSTGPSAYGRLAINSGATINVLGNLTLERGALNTVGTSSAAEINLTGNLIANCASPGTRDCASKYQVSVSEYRQPAIVFVGSTAQTYAFATGARGPGMIIDKTSKTDTVSPVGASPLGLSYLEVRRGTLTLSSGETRIGWKRLSNPYTVNYGLVIPNDSTQQEVLHNSGTLIFDGESDHEGILSLIDFAGQSYTFNHVNFDSQFGAARGYVEFANVNDVLVVNGTLRVNAGYIRASAANPITYNIDTKNAIEINCAGSGFCSQHPATVNMSRLVRLRLSGNNTMITQHASAAWPFSRVDFAKNSSFLDLILMSNLDLRNTNSPYANWGNLNIMTGTITLNSRTFTGINNLTFNGLTAATCSGSLGYSSVTGGGGTGCP